MSGTRRKPGRMGPYVEGFQTRLLKLGYTPCTVRNMLKVVGQLGRWMDTEDIAPGDLNKAAIGAFLGACRVRGTRRVPGVRSFDPLFDYLRCEGVLDAEPAAPSTPVEMLVMDYRKWLVIDRGLAS